MFKSKNRRDFIAISNLSAEQKENIKNIEKLNIKTNISSY